MFGIKKKLKLAIVLSMLLPIYAQAVIFEGYVTELYASEYGSVAFKVEGGFPEAVVQQCSSFNGFGGNTGASDFMKSVLLAAKVSHAKLRFSMSGCDASGDWIKVVSVYLL
jgi:hypothetical protein